MGVTSSHIFLSYSRSDREAAVNLHHQLERHGLSVFRDEKNIAWSDKWLTELQDNVRTCSGFVLLIGRDGVRRWVGAETEVALIRHIDPRDPAQRLPIFPILLDGVPYASLPAFLWSCQAISWDGVAAIDRHHLDRIRANDDRAKDRHRLPADVCPFVGLDAFGPEQARLFFGRQKEALEILAYFDRRPGRAIRWVEINGISGSGKSSLMNAAVLPLIEKGWLWRRTGYGTWRHIGPMMPGERPVEMLAEKLAQAFGTKTHEVWNDLQADDNALRFWLRDWKSPDNPGDTAFLLAIDQFEELFTFADPKERECFDRLLAAALQDHDCPLYVLSTVRSDFFDRFAEDLPRLVEVRNGPAKLWTVPKIDREALREIITQPALLADLDVDEVVDPILDDAAGEPGALPLVENALDWLWRQPREGNRLSGRLFHAQGKLGGILSNNADRLLDSLEPDERQRALDVLLAMVRPDEDNRRHTRRRITLADGVRIAGGGNADRGRVLIDRLEGRRALDGGKPSGPVRLITVAPGEVDGEGGWINLIHETLIRCKAGQDSGDPQPFWPALWKHIEDNREKALRRDHVLALAPIIEAAAIAWDRAGRAEPHRWEEQQLLPKLRDIRESGLSINDVIRPGISPAFCGPTDPHEIIEMLGFTEADDATRGSGRYGDLWRLPLGHARRGDLAERLAIVGDPRRGIHLDADGLPDIDWRKIEAGTVVIKGRTMNVVAFRMARYPVTVAQFRAFVVECFRNGEWQLPPGFTWPMSEDPPKHRTTRENHAADSVSWCDAQAFCHWLGTRLGCDIRLPTEAEWQLAATDGDPNRTYPWGTDWDPSIEQWLANTFESGLGKTLPVGFYPLGASPAGVVDLSGTLWEWCSDAYELDADEPRHTIPWYKKLWVRKEESKVGSSESAPRVLRGGSWSSSQDYARSAFRSWYDPYSRDGSVGFRVVCSSPSSGH